MFLFIVLGVLFVLKIKIKNNILFLILTIRSFIKNVPLTLSFGIYCKPCIFNKQFFLTKRVVLTDNKTFALFVRCTNGLKSYYIASPQPHLSQSAILQSVAKIMQLGFDVTLFTKIPSTHSFCSP